MRIALAPFLVLATLSACALPSLSVQPRYGRLDVSGSAGVTSGGVGGSADLEDAGLDSDDSFSGRVDFKFGSPHLIGLVQAPRFEGSGTLDVTVSNGTDTITAGASVDSKVDLEMYDLALVFDLVPGDMVEAGVGFGAAYMDLAFLFEENGTGTTVASDEAIPIPILAAAASVWIGPVQVGAFAGGMDLSYNDDSVSFVDADLYARWKLFGGSKLLRGSLVVGYRYTDFDLDYDDDSSDVDTSFTIQGPYIGLEGSL